MTPQKRNRLGKIVSVSPRADSKKRQWDSQYGSMVFFKREIMEVKEKLADINGMTWPEIFAYYYPDWGWEKCNEFLWNATSYPFSSSMAHDQIYEYYLNETERLGK